MECKKEKNWKNPKYNTLTSARASMRCRARRGSNTRPLDLQSNALPTAPQAQVLSFQQICTILYLTHS
jgi:hypothetical protein